ncbi:AAA family ATPase [Flavivirga spongiicola]|uniref:Rad50/SbcC-type AAA domain-containing protein n=1 Tax=Flavivirga spongiicola TaxID=421621 RepID=A0ABU7XTU9_9FLAO|nr:AAA family ATPase [Flavivirga sp. MEBiC05379]MDO5979207.1 hypothetical protein [Flavivirga sp. MEBiC05379]
MYFRFQSLIIQCRKERVLINLSHQISFFHGKIGSGKSSLVRLIDFALGGKLEYTSAINQEFVSCTLSISIGENDVIIDRESKTNNVRVTWTDSDKEGFTLLAPIDADKNPIFGETIHNLSDLLFFLLDIEPPKSRKSKLQEDTEMVRVSFRDFMWYCYLKQEYLDSSFYRLEDTFKRNKSRDVMRYVVGYHSEELSKLEGLLFSYKNEKSNYISNVESLKTLMTKFDFESVDEIEKKAETNKNKLFDLKKHKDKLESGYQSETHLVDSLRKNARKNIVNLEISLNALSDLKSRIDDQISLKNELLASKFKMARSISIAHVLDNVKFDLCPSCGTDIKNAVVNEDDCYLCHSDLNKPDEKANNIETIRLDIDSRIEELDNSVIIHKKELDRQRRLIKKLENFKENIDDRINTELKNYDSKYLSSFREVDRSIATIEERIRGFNRLKKIPTEISLIEGKIIKSDSNISKTKERILAEKNKFNKASKIISELETKFVETLLDISFPGVNKGDIAKINRTTWNIYVYPKGNEDRKWSFENAGSGGKKTLFNVAYLLSIHIVAENNGLPLPNFIIIDTPMKNIGEDVNSEIFDNFYKLLYNLSANELLNTQFVIVDKDFVMPEFEVDLYDRYMTPDDPDNPPLIPYYRGA